MVVDTIKNLQKPDVKVTTGLLSGALMSILAWAVGEFTTVKIPPEIAVAGSTVIGFVLAYFVKNQ